MIPTFRPGDALLVVPVTASQLKIGDVVSYHNPRQPTEVISHRLISINQTTGWLKTAGDALQAPDPPFPPQLILGRAMAVAPKLGLVLDALRSPTGLILAAYLPAAVLIVTEVRQLARIYARPIYSARL